MFWGFVKWPLFQRWLWPNFRPIYFQILVAREKSLSLENHKFSCFKSSSSMQWLWGNLAWNMWWLATNNRNFYTVRWVLFYFKKQPAPMVLYNGAIWLMLSYPICSSIKGKNWYCWGVALHYGVIPIFDTCCPFDKKCQMTAIKEATWKATSWLKNILFSAIIYEPTTHT